MTQSGTAQLELFASAPETPPEPTLVNQDRNGAATTTVYANRPGACCKHWRLQHRQAVRAIGEFGGEQFRRCDFCACPAFKGAS